MESYPLETGASAGTHGVKDEDIVQEITPVASRTLTEEERATVSGIVSEVALLCFPYDVHFENLAKELELGLG